MLKWILPAVFVPGLLFAQMPMGGVCPGRVRPARDLNLSETQQKQIETICKDSSRKLFDLREAWKKAEKDLQAAFDESPLDQHKSNEAIERLAAARLEAFRATSQMDLKIRTVLTDEQWQELKSRERVAGRGRPGPDRGGWRRGGSSTKGTAPIGQPQSK